MSRLIRKKVWLLLAKRFVSSNKLNKLFDDALSQIDDSGVIGLLDQWRENMKALAKFYGSSAGGDKK